MSARALVRAVAARLQSAAVLNDPDGKVCSARPNGKPPPGFGQVFYAVWWSGSSERGDHTTVEYTDCDHGVTVTVTGRRGVVPNDRRFKLIEDEADLVDLAEAVAAPGLIHGNYADVVDDANALITGFAVSTNGFIEPLRLIQIGPVVERGPEWSGSKDGRDVFSVDVAFGRARRITIA